MKLKPYVGIKPDGAREVFRSTVEPTRISRGDQFIYCIGPFRTVRAAHERALHGAHFRHERKIAVAKGNL